jgi:von Willebrand factor A domain-containing protein 8
MYKSDLVPHNKFSIPHEPNEHHFKWLIQKYLMKQDVILMGPPSSFRRRLVMALAEARGWEVEYLAITKDTTESDLKQRREIIGDTAVYADQPPVRAAVHGRVLILDGECVSGRVGG